VNVLRSYSLATDLIENQSHPLSRPHTIEEPMPRQGRKSKKLQEVIPFLKSEYKYRASIALHLLYKKIHFASIFAAVNTFLAE
tara:strand:- start:29 stop:277 length:249 start_codon:yes stop_codon:yes gene_type:complete